MLGPPRYATNLIPKYATHLVNLGGQNGIGALPTPCTTARHFAPTILFNALLAHLIDGALGIRDSSPGSNLKSCVGHGDLSAWGLLHPVRHKRDAMLCFQFFPFELSQKRVPKIILCGFWLQLM